MVELIVNVGLPLLLLVTGIVTNIMVNRNRARFLAVVRRSTGDGSNC